MKNIVGQTPRGPDFYPRDKIINKVYRRIDSGSHIFLAAPRRVGKTSIMRFLEDNPQKGYQFVYIITESVHDIEEFYQKLLEELLKSEAIGKLIKSKENFGKWIKGVINRIESIKFPWLEVNLEGQKVETFQSAFSRLIQEYKDAEGNLVIMIDEFPQTIENIKIKHGELEAIRFLRLQREQRQFSDPKIRFLYTGSIGLPNVVRKITSTSVINDLNVLDIPPLSEKEAREFTQRILNNYQIPYREETIEALLTEINWLIPFHLQLAIQELIDVHDNTGLPLGSDSVPLAIDQLLNVRNDIYFEHYYRRLRSIFKGNNYQFAIDLLSQLSKHSILPAAKIEEIAKKNGINGEMDNILSALEYDGYIHFDHPNKVYRFNSYLLQKWWNKKNPN